MCLYPGYLQGADNLFTFRGMDDRWLELEERTIPLKVKLLGLPIKVKKKAYYSVYGPVVKNETGVFAFKMGVFDEIRAIEQWYEMNKATNLQEFKTAMSTIRIPSFNTVYADRYGEIFYVSNGLLPKRNPDYDWTSTLPGNTAKTITREYHPFEDLPQLSNPASGYLFNTNNSPFNATLASDNLTLTHYRQYARSRSLVDNSKNYFAISL